VNHSHRLHSLCFDCGRVKMLGFERQRDMQPYVSSVKHLVENVAVGHDKVLG
jgi:hypothetical protein